MMLPKNNPERSEQKKSTRSASENKQYRAIIIGFSITAILIVGLVGYAVLYESQLKYRIPVAVVNGQPIDNQYFQDRVRLERNSYVQQFNMIYAQYQLFAEDPNMAQFYQSQLAQVQQLLDDTKSFAKIVLDKVIDEEILTQKAVEMGISVSEAEVDEAIQELFRYYPNGTPTPQPTFPPVSTPTPSQAQMDLLNYTPTPSIAIEENATKNTSETSTEEIPSTELKKKNEENLAGEETQTLEPTAVFTQTPQPTPTIYTEDIFLSKYQSYLGDLEAINVKESSLRKYLYTYLVVQKVRDEVIKDIPREQEQVWARHILVKTLPEALIVLDRLDKGEDWAAIAAEVSLDTSNKDIGGDLGWFPRGRMVEPFENAAFSLEPGEISQPIESQFGFHIIQVIGKETFPLNDVDFESLQETYYQKWFKELRDSADIKINDVWQELAPKEPNIPPELKIY